MSYAIKYVIERKGQPIINNETEAKQFETKTGKGFIGDNMHGSFKKMLKESIHESQKCQRNWNLDATISEEDKKLILRRQQILLQNRI